MKQVLYLFILLFLVGCTDTLVENVPAIVEEKEEIYAIIEGSDSRTYLDEQGRMRWTADDRITLFKKTHTTVNLNLQGKLAQMLVDSLKFQQTMNFGLDLM